MKKHKNHNPNYRASSEEEFTHALFHNASFASLESQKRDFLKKFLSDEKKHVLYVFDTDIIIGFCAPWIIGPLDEKSGQNGYGQILPLRFFGGLTLDQYIKGRNEERETATNVARMVTNFALKNIKNESIGNTVFQLPSHFEETIRIYKAVKSKVDRLGETRNSSNERLSRDVIRSLALLRSISNKSYENTDHPLNEITSSVILKLADNSLSKRSAVREWDNFYKLNTRFNGLFRTTEFIDSQQDKTKSSPPKSTLKKIKKILKQNHQPDSDSRVTLDKYALEFEKLLKSKKGRQESFKNVSDDASALADLFYINQKFVEEQIPCRMVLITGDQHLTKAVSEGLKKPKFLDKEFLSKFGYYNVHHLWSYVDDIAYSDITTQLSNNFQKKKLFSGLLAYQNEDQDDELKIDYHPKEPLKRITQRDIKNTRKEWASFANMARTESYTIEYGESFLEKIEDLRTAIIKIVSKNDHTLNSWPQVLKAVNEEVFRARDRANVSFSDIGAETLVQSNENGIRNPPDLMFDTLDNTDRIFRNLASPEEKYRSAEEFEDDFVKIADDCHDSSVDKDDRQEIYLKYVVLGALFASANRWNVAEQHSEYAIDIIERAKSRQAPIPVKDVSGDFMNGREAWYLKAVARRIQARTIGDFKDSLNFLKKAKKCLAVDRENNSGKRVPIIRFLNEHLENKLAQYYFCRKKIHLKILVMCIFVTKKRKKYFLLSVKL